MNSSIVEVMDNDGSVNLSTLDRARIAQENVTGDGIQRNDKTARTRSSGAVKGPGFRQRFAPMLNLVTHILILVFTVYIVTLASREDTLFSWHPPLLTVGVSIHNLTANCSAVFIHFRKIVRLQDLFYVLFLYY